MSWLFSQALVEAYSAGRCLDGQPSAQLNVMPSERPFWRNDKPIDVVNRSPFGLTWRRLTDDHGAALLTWYREDFLARTSAARAREQGSTERKADYGVRWPESLARYDHVTRSWRTAQSSLFGGYTEFSGTWPRWGMMRDGVSYPLPMPSGLSAFHEVISRLLTICENASGSSQRTPTATTQDACGRDRQNQKNGGVTLSLLGTVRRAPTATSDTSTRDKRYAQGGLPLTAWVGQVQRMTTPQAHDALTGNPDRVGRFGTKHGGRNLNDEIAAMALTQRAPTSHSEDSQCAGGHRGTADTLVAFTRLPTATRMDAEQAGSLKRGPTLHNRLASPAVRDWKSGKGRQENGHTMQLCEQVGGQLNPEWEDWFMGFPTGWTDVRHLETRKYQQWLDSHGVCSPRRIGDSEPR